MIEPPEISVEEIEMQSFQYNQGKRQRNKSVHLRRYVLYLISSYYNTSG